MPENGLLQQLHAQRAWHAGGHTRPYAARRDALKALAASLRKHEADVLEALHQDMRKPAFEAYLGEIGLVHREIRHALAHLRAWMRPERVPTPLALQVAISTVERVPLGVVLIVAPWNYPVLLTLAPLIGAVAAGDCAVLKPSEDAPRTAAVVERIVREAFPPGWVSVVQGPGADVLSPLIEGFRFDHVFFTGSPRVGAIIAGLAAPQLVPVTLELGGKSPAIVDRRVDVRTAAARIAWGKFFNAGQTCIAPDHALVHADVMEPFLAAFTEALRRFFGDDPRKSPHYARIVNMRRFDALKGYLPYGRTVAGGDHDAAERYIAPTVLVDVPLDAPPMQEEIFGPILPVIPWREREEALAIVRRNPFPLAAYLFGRDARTLRHFQERMAFGGGCINHCLAHFGSPYLPVGGVGTSGMGSYRGRASFELFSQRRSIVRSATWPDPGVQYPPYTPLKQRLLRFFLK